MTEGYTGRCSGNHTHAALWVWLQGRWRHLEVVGAHTDGAADADAAWSLWPRPRAQLLRTCTSCQPQSLPRCVVCGWRALPATACASLPRSGLERGGPAYGTVVVPHLHECHSIRSCVHGMFYT